MGEFNPITTQEQFDLMISDRLKREQATAAKQFEGYTSPADLQKIKADYEKQIGDLNAAMNTEKQKYADFEKNMAEKDAKIKGYETASVKTRIAHEMGLSYEATDFLQGDDEAAIRKSAETLKGLIGKVRQAPPLNNPEGDSGAKSKDAAFKSMLQKLNGGN